MTKILHIPTGIILSSCDERNQILPINFLYVVYEMLNYTDDKENLPVDIRKCLCLLYNVGILPSDPEDYGITWTKCINYAQENVSLVEFEVLDD